MKRLLLIAFVLAGCGQIVTYVPVPGPSGPPGRRGKGCSVTQLSPNDVAPNGGAVITCEDDTSALIINGTDGQAGLPGTTITPVQFCPSCHGTYPNVFPEVGFKMNDKIWAVYSANGGFLTEVLPGRYSSNGIGCNCTFIVNQDGSITH